MPKIERPALNISELLASLAVQVRKDTDPESSTNDTIDTRDKQAREWCTRVNNSELIELIDPHDCAAIFSCCVGVMHPASARRVAEAKPNKLAKLLIELTHSNKLPLAARPDHPAAEFLAMLLCMTENAGRELYRAMAVLLLEAQSDKDAKRLLYNPPGRSREEHSPIVPTIDDMEEPDRSQDHVEVIPCLMEDT